MPRKTKPNDLGETWDVEVLEELLPSDWQLVYRDRRSEGRGTSWVAKRSARKGESHNAWLTGSLVQTVIVKALLYDDHELGFE